MAAAWQISCGISTHIKQRWRELDQQVAISICRPLSHHQSISKRCTPVAVHLTTLGGRPASTHSIDNVYPCSAKCDEVMEQFDRRWLSASEHENSFDALEGKMIIVDLSDENGPDFRVAKILRRTQDGNFEIHYYETRDRKAALSRKKFHPNWYEPNPKGPGHLEKCTADPSDAAIANTSDFELKEMLFEPFELTKKHHIPNSIVEKLQLNGFVCLVIDFTMPFAENFGPDEPSRKRKAESSTHGLRFLS